MEYRTATPEAPLTPGRRPIALALDDLLAFYRDELDFPADAKLTVSTRDEFGNTPLHIAARLGETEHVALLLAHGANIDAIGEDGATPLHDAAGYGRDETVAVLLKAGARRNLRDEDGMTPEEAARELGHNAVADLIAAAG